MTRPWYEKIPPERSHWWDTVEPCLPINRESVHWTTPGESMVGRVVGVQDIPITYGPWGDRPTKRVYFFDTVDGRRVLVWGTGALNDWFTCRPTLLSRLVRIRYLGAFIDRREFTHLRFAVGVVGRGRKGQRRA